MSLKLILNIEKKWLIGEVKFISKLKNVLETLHTRCSGALVGDDLL